MTVAYDTLGFEVTRRCNMMCEHCLRGDPQDLDISDDIIDLALENACSIDNIFFTGGEPSLNVHAIRHTLDVCKEREIPVYGFFLATNGKHVTHEFLHVLMDWFIYCSLWDADMDYFTLALSQDKFHENIPRENIMLLRALSFFNEEDKKTDFDRYSPMQLGRARGLTNVTRPTDQYRLSYHVETEADADGELLRFYHGNITVTANGLYLPACDYEYAEEEKIAIGTVYDHQAYESYLLGCTDSYQANAG